MHAASSGRSPLARSTLTHHPREPSVRSRCVCIYCCARTHLELMRAGVTTSAYSTLRYLTLHTYIVRANRRVDVTGNTDYKDTGG